MAITLTTDQRWLMWAIGGWQIRECLLSPAGTDRFMYGMCSAYNIDAPEGGPAWLTSWDATNRKISAPSRGGVRVVLTAAQINTYASQLPADVRAELEACRIADRAETKRTDGWCRCPWADEAPNAHSGPCRRYHPTDDEDQDHYDNCWRIRERTTDALRRALGIDSGQLDLFADSGQLALF